MKKQIIFLFFFLCISIACIAWDIRDKMNAHEAINGAAISYFSLNFKNNGKSLDEETKYFGIAWHVGSEKSITQKNLGFKRTETFTDWVKIGGVDADINSRSSETFYSFAIEKPLRHFYDPINTPSYLTDFSPKGKDKLVDPKMDHITWALTELTHRWSFYQGLLLYKAAMENVAEKDLPAPIANYSWYLPSKEVETPIPTVPVHYNVVKDEGSLRDYLFAASFRALGETLHCAGDLCMPAHVRDDSHGSLEIIGGADPIEYTVCFDMATRILQQNSNTVGKDFLNKKSSVETLLKGCALFTNKSFFSRDTICNKDPHLKPTTFNQKVYDSPSFEETSLETTIDDERLYHTFGSKRVILLIRKWSDHWSKTAPKIEYLVPPEAAEGQASVLLPLAAAAGGEIIDRFLPTMQLALETSKDQNNSIILNGSLVHDIDKDIEWKSIGAIKYCGEGEIKVNGSPVATATFVDGVMNTVKGMSFKANDKVQLVVKAGALIHNSNTVIISDAVVITPAITLTCLKSSNFTQLLQKVAVEDSRRVGYIGTLKPEIMATVLAEGNDTIAYNWWCDDATGTWVSDYFAPFTYSTFPYHDRPIFSQDGITPKDLKPKQIENTKYFCAPAGNHTLHIRAYYGSGAYQGLLESPVDKSSRNYVQKDVTFTVTAATSPIIRYKGDAPWEEISFKETAVEENFTGPEWAPHTWKRLKFKFDGPYTCYFDYTNNPNFKITGFYKDGIPSDHWKINCSSCRWVFDYDATGKIVSGVMKYDGDGNLVAKYTTSDLISPSFLVLHEQTYNSPTVINAHVEIFRSGNEIYNEQYNVVESVKKEGPYSYTKSDFKTVAGFYKNNVPTGFWEINNFSSGKWLFELNSEGEVLSGVKKYDSDGNLMAQYTSNTFVEPSFKATFRESSKAFESVETAYVETYSSAIEEKYYIVDGLKEGSYNSIKPNGERASGQYSRGRQIGVWSYYNPEFSPPEYTKTY